jgi:sugar lactone lactonase YvrE
MKDYIITERNLVPEGTAYDNRTGTLYISSTFKRKIIQISKEGTITDFIPQKYEGIESVAGMEVDEERGILWANTGQANVVLPLMDPDSSREWKTSLWAFDIDQRKLLRKYELNTDTAFLNDLTVLPNGDVYITETVNNKIYRVTSSVDSLALFLAPQGFTFLNGISYARDHHSLYVSCTEGIIKIDLSNTQYVLLPTADSIDAGSIDGLTYYKNKLIGHQSSRVSIFHLNPSGGMITKTKILDSGVEFDATTTGEIGVGYYYFIVNSQIQSAIDHEHHTIKPQEQLKDIIIRRVKL